MCRPPPTVSRPLSSACAASVSSGLTSLATSVAVPPSARATVPLKKRGASPAAPVRATLTGWPGRSGRSVLSNASRNPSGCSPIAVTVTGGGARRLGRRDVDERPVERVEPIDQAGVDELARQRQRVGRPDADAPRRAPA